MMAGGVCCGSMISTGALPMGREIERAPWPVVTRSLVEADMKSSTMKRRTYGPPSPAGAPPPNAAQHAEAARWQHGIRMFLRELDALVASGRIDPDARSVIRWTLTRAVPKVARGAEGRAAAAAKLDRLAAE